MLKIMRRIIAGFVGFYLALWGLTVYIHYPSPVAAITLGLAAPSESGALMPFHTVTATSPSALETTGAETMPQSIDWYGNSTAWSDFLTATNTNAFLVIRDGVLTHEWYRDGITADQKLPSYSVAKSVVSILAGQLIAAGKLSESDPFIKYYPEYSTGTTFDTVTIGQLLDMRSGVAVADNYPTGPSGWGAPIAQMYATTDLPNFVLNHREVYWKPGSQVEYRSIDTQLVGMVIQKITGKTLSDLLQQKVWAPLGAEFDATWNVDHVGGFEKGFCCLNMAARDYAKLGMLMVNDGVATPTASGVSTQVVPAAWLTRMGTSVSTLEHGWGYAAFTWLPYANTQMFLGLHGQFVYSVPGTNTVIIKLSDNLTDVDNEETVKILQQIATTPPA